MIRRFQFRLRTLLIVVVPYVAVYALVLSSILSDDGKPEPVANEWKFLADLRTAIHTGIAESMQENLAISFTVAWSLLPLLAWATCRSTSMLRRLRRSTPS